jgi:hypothetical protein
MTAAHSAPSCVMLRPADCGAALRLTTRSLPTEASTAARQSGQTAMCTAGWNQRWGGVRACACVCARVCVHLCARQRQGGGETSIADWSSGTTAVRTTESWHRGPTAAACSTHILHACPCCSTVARTARRRRTSLCRRQVAVSRAADVGPDNPHTRARAHRLHVICSYCGVVVRATLRVMRRQLRKIVPQTHARTRTHARVHRSTSVHFGVDGPPRCLGTALVGVHAGGGTVTHSQHAD